jgi:hypothetical protein
LLIEAFGLNQRKNTLVAFERALQNGFGIETDFRIAVSGHQS